MAVDSDSINATRRFWETKCARTVSSEDAREIIRNAVGFFGILAEWAAEEASSAGKSDGPLSASSETTLPPDSGQNNDESRQSGGDHVVSASI